MVQDRFSIKQYFVESIANKESDLHLPRLVERSAPTLFDRLPEDTKLVTDALSIKTSSGQKFFTNQAKIVVALGLEQGTKNSSYPEETNEVLNRYYKNVVLKSTLLAPTAIAQSLVNNTGIRLGGEGFVTYLESGSIGSTFNKLIKPDDKKQSSSNEVSRIQNPRIQNPRIQNATEGIQKFLKKTYEGRTSRNPHDDPVPSLFIPKEDHTLFLNSNNKYEIKEVKPPNPPKNKRDYFLKVNSTSTLQIPLTDDDSVGIDLLNYQPAILEDRIEGNNYDYIPFRIKTIPPGDGSNDRNANKPAYIYFRAFLDNLDDDFTGEWDSVNYIGRGENLFTYSGFSRTITFGFKIAAQTRDEVIPLYKKLNLLVSTLAPQYNLANSNLEQSTTFMKGVFTRLTIGDYISDLPGFFKSINMRWETSYPWETNSRFRDTDVLFRSSRTEAIKAARVPHILDVSCTFNPIHDFSPAYRQPFILNNPDYVSFTPTPLL